MLLFITITTSCPFGFRKAVLLSALRLGELITFVECSEVFAQRAASVLDGKRFDKSPDRFDGEALAAMAAGDFDGDGRTDVFASKCD